MKVCLDLLAVTAAGQLPRARAFLERFEQFAPTSELLVLKDATTLNDYTSTDRRVVVNVPIGLGKLKALRRTWWENTVMQGLMREHAADVYLTFSHYLPHMHNASMPSVVGVSNLAPFSPEAWASESYPIRLKLAILRRTILSSARRASRVLALSTTARQVLIRCGIPREKIALVPVGVDTYWGQTSANPGLLADLGITRPFLLYVSHFYRYKNHARLVEAFARLPSALRSSHQLLFVGRPYDLTCYNRTQALVDRMSLSDDVRLIPGESGDRLRALYQLAKAFVFPSLVENSPNILLEAMMAGAPIMASNIQPMPEYCGEAGEYFDALDVQSMSDKISAVLVRPEEELRKMSECSRAQAGKFSWGKFVGEVLDQCQLVTGSGR